VDDPRVHQKVQSSVRIAREEFLRWHVTLSAVARAAGGHDVPRRMCPAARQRLHVVQGGRLEIERGSTVDTPAAAITERRALEGALVRGAGARCGLPRADCEGPRQSDAMKVPLDEAMVRHLCSGIGNRESGIGTDRRDSIFGIADSGAVRRRRSDWGWQLL
jgi:hypothetical protein